MGEVVKWGGITKLDLPPNDVLQGAIDKGLSTAVVIGFDHDGDFFFASSAADGGEVLWLMALAHKRLLEVAEE